MRILTICGSLQKESTNGTLLEVVGYVAPAHVEVVRFEGLGDLPHFNPDLDVGEPPPPVTAWRRALSGADAVLIASPEYGHSLPGVLKNGIDWVIGSGELHRKIVAITSSVVDRRRGRRGLCALAQTLAAVDAVVVWDEPTVRDRDFDREIAGIVHRVIQKVDNRKDGDERMAHTAFPRSGKPCAASPRGSRMGEPHGGGVQNSGRLEALRRTCLLDSPAEEAFDRLTWLATALLRVSVAYVSLVDDHRQFFKSQRGMSEPLATVRQTPLSHSFCRHAVESREPADRLGRARCIPYSGTTRRSESTASSRTPGFR